MAMFWGGRRAMHGVDVSNAADITNHTLTSALVSRKPVHHELTSALIRRKQVHARNPLLTSTPWPASLPQNIAMSKLDFLALHPFVRSTVVDKVYGTIIGSARRGVGGSNVNDAVG